MNEELHITYVEQPDGTAWGAIGGGIQAYNTQQAGDDEGRPLCFLLYTPDQEIVGGLIGATYWDWLYVDLMWVRADLRGQGYGHQLLSLAEEEARKRGARHAHLDTFSFQAPDFYRRHGYRVFGELPEFPAGHRRYYLTKEL